MVSVHTPSILQDTFLRCDNFCKILLMEKLAKLSPHTNKYFDVYTSHGVVKNLYNRT